jgi:hypothetical protein
MCVFGRWGWATSNVEFSNVSANLGVSICKVNDFETGIAALISLLPYFEKIE